MFSGSLLASPLAIKQLFSSSTVHSPVVGIVTLLPLSVTISNSSGRIEAIFSKSSVLFSLLLIFTFVYLSLIVALSTVVSI